MPAPEIEETAKATQEVAKTAGKAIDASCELGGFFSRIFGVSLEQLVGIGEDHLTVYRRTRQLRLAKRYEEIRKELGFDSEIKPAELKFGLPLIEAASVENDGCSPRPPILTAKLKPSALSFRSSKNLDRSRFC
jgi:hypothetical protein